MQERAAKDKHEYFKGQIVGLAGASLRHNRIAASLITELGLRLKRQPCEVLPSDIRVCTPSRDAYMYPDATIVCGEPEMEDGMFDTLKIQESYSRYYRLLPRIMTGGGNSLFIARYLLLKNMY